MLIEPAADAASFACFPEDPPDYADAIASLWDSDPLIRDWAFVCRDGDAVVGRVGFRRWDTTSDPAFLGSLPPEEAGVYGLRLGTGSIGDGARFLRAAVARCGMDRLPETLEISTNPEVHHEIGQRLAVAEAAGFALFQEKRGYVWEDRGQPVVVSDRLSFATIADVGAEIYADVMTRCQKGTLDRNDRYYLARGAPGSWGRQMTEFCDEEDRTSWLLGSDAGEVVGYTALGAFDEPETATIAHIGVLPDLRGRGYIHELLAAANAAARRRGFRIILSDVDVLNTPMHDAMLRAGHRNDARPWHRWVHRATPEDLVA